ATADQADPRVLDLAARGRAAQLLTHLVDEAEAQVAAFRELTAGGVERELTGQADSIAPLDERTGLPASAEPQGLEPEQREDAEPVVEGGHVDVVGPDRRARPELAGRVMSRHLAEVGPEAPARCSRAARTHRLEEDRSVDVVAVVAV